MIVAAATSSIAWLLDPAIKKIFLEKDQKLIFIIPLAIIIGYFDMKKGTYRVEQRMAKNLSPIWVEVFEKLDNLDTQQKEIMSKL